MRKARAFVYWDGEDLDQGKIHEQGDFKDCQALWSSQDADRQFEGQANHRLHEIESRADDRLDKPRQSNVVLTADPADCEGVK